MVVKSVKMELNKKLKLLLDVSLKRETVSVYTVVKRVQKSGYLPLLISETLGDLKSFMFAISFQESEP